jgi:tetratricopeptide (TPR) repeat protein
MASAAFTITADCLRDLGRWDEAASAYQECIVLAEQRKNKRSVAINKFQLGTIRIQQQKYDEALEIYSEAQVIFEGLGEPRSVAEILRGIGIAYREKGQFGQAERAYRQALAIKVQQKDLEGEAASLYELGHLYDGMGRLEEAVILYQQVADICVKLHNSYREGMTRSSLANTLVKPRRYDEARREALRAIECNESYGYVAVPWKTWDILQDLERESGNPEAAAQARRRAVESYLAYRCAGGQSMTYGAQLCALAAQAIAQGNTDELEQQLVQLLESDVPPYARILISKVQAVIHGERNSARR